jgi:hypothetical protein
MTEESGKMFGLIDLRVASDDSKNASSGSQFENIVGGDFDAFEKPFPVEGFKVTNVFSAKGITIEDVQLVQWEDSSIYFECLARWAIDTPPGNFELWGAVFRGLWGDSSLEITHSLHPGLVLRGYFPDAPEYS